MLMDSVWIDSSGFWMDSDGFCLVSDGSWKDSVWILYGFCVDSDGFGWILMDSVWIPMDSDGF